MLVETLHAGVVAVAGLTRKLLLYEVAVEANISTLSSARPGPLPLSDVVETNISTPGAAGPGSLPQGEVRVPGLVVLPVPLPPRSAGSPVDPGPIPSW